MKQMAVKGNRTTTDGVVLEGDETWTTDNPSPVTWTSPPVGAAT